MPTYELIHLVDVHALGVLELERGGLARDPDEEFGVEVDDACPLLGDHLDVLVWNAADVLLGRAAAHAEIASPSSIRIARWTFCTICARLLMNTLQAADIAIRYLIIRISLANSSLSVTIKLSIIPNTSLESWLKNLAALMKMFLPFEKAIFMSCG